MNIKAHDLDKQEIIKKLQLVREILSKLIEQVESGGNWELSHTQLVVAITQLKSVTKQLAIHHIVVCIAHKLRKGQSMDSSERNINEFIKTFNYIH